MRLEYQILAAVALDLALGDPRWLPHPVRGIGWLAARLERFAARGSAARKVRRPAWRRCTVYACVGGLAAWGADSRWRRLAGPVAADVASIVVIYTTHRGARPGPAQHGRLRPLVAGDLPEARRRVARIVGRDTSGWTNQAWSARPWKAWPRARWTA